MAEEATRVVRSFCRICTAECGILAEVQGERVVRVVGDREHPLSRGYTCPKGRALPRLHHHPERLEKFFLRREGGWTAVTAAECLDDLAEKLRCIVERHGPAAVGIYFGSGLGMDAAGYPLCERLRSTLGTPAKFSPLTIDGTAKALVGGLMGGFPGLSGRPDYEEARLVIYAGINPVVSHGHAVALPLPPSKTIQAVARRGAVWVLDPRVTETVRFATGHLRLRPGSDYAVFAYLVRALLAEGADSPDLARGQREALAQAVAPYDRGRAAAVAGVPEADLAALLADVRRAGRLAVETGTGVTMAESANVTQWLAWALMAVTDSLNRPGGYWFHPGLLRPLDQGELPILPPEALFGPGPPSRPELPGFLGEWPGAALADEIEAGNIRAFLNLGGNLLTAFPDATALEPALRKLEVLATLDILPNATTRLSTHLLPVWDQLERPDLSCWDMLSPKVCAQYTPAVVRPVGERRAAWWILAELIRRLGGELPPGLPADDRAPGAAEEALARLAGVQPAALAELRARGYVEAPRILPAPWVERHLARLGGWRLAPAQLVAQLEALRAREAGGPPPLALIPRRQQRHVNAQLTFLGDRPEVLIHPRDAAARGIADGAPVEVRSPRGAVRALARVDEGIRPGVVSVPHGFEAANVNHLTDDALADAVTGMARYSGLAVEVVPHP